MIVYREASRDEETGAMLARLARRAADGDAPGFLVELGELEQGVLDALRPERDGWGPVEACFGRAAAGAGGAYLAWKAGRAAGVDLVRSLALLGPVGGGLPGRVRVKPPEGYVHYALDPAGYAAAAERYRADAGPAAGRAVVVGLRSIGTSLSAVVAAVLGTSRRLTVRPRGETGARRVEAEGPLVARVLALLAEGGDVLVVDEGPGATGETLAAAAAWLGGLGVPDDRIVLLPSRVWGLPLAPEERQAWFARATKYAPPCGDGRPARLAERLGLAELEDLSAGRWREVVDGAAGEPACVPHERSKHRGRDRTGRRWQLRFAGLGAWGDAAAARALALEEAGAGPTVGARSEGFLALRWVEGRPLRRGERVPGLVRGVARYLCGRAALFRTGRAAEPRALTAMLLQNGAEALGSDAPGLAAAARRLERLPEREAVVPDARLQPREWLVGRKGLRKVDALDHGDGLRLPGPTDLAWDAAGASVEFALDHAAEADLVARIAAAAGDCRPELAHAVVAHRAAYAACALGSAVLSAREAPTAADRARLEAEAAFYRRALRRELDRAA